MVPVLIAVLAVAGVVGWRLLPNATDAHAGPPTSTPSGATTASPKATGGSTPSAAAGAADRAAAALKGCRAKVAAADKVLAAAETGVGHWREHVQAQTDADTGRLTVVQMDAVFARTRLAGPDDQERYAKARDAYDAAAADGSCSAVADAPAKEAAAFSRCHTRAVAQRPVLEAAEPAMADWKSHLAAMARSRSHHMDDAQEIWIEAWRAAPPHIKAYDKAMEGYDPPDC